MRTMLAGVLLGLLFSTGVLARTWTDKTGKFRVEAELVSVADGKVTLKRADNGKEITIPLLQLSAADRKFFRDNKAAGTTKPPRSSPPEKTPASKTVPVETALMRQTNIAVAQQPLADVVAKLGEQTGCNIVLDLRAMEEVGVARDSPITGSVQGTLDEILRQIVDPLELAYVARHEVLLITSKEQAASSGLQVRVYRLLRPTSADALIDDITSKVATTSWNETGGPASISALEAGALIISQTADAHRVIVENYGKLLAPLAPPVPRNVKTISVDYAKTPLNVVATQIADMAKMKIEIDEPALEKFGVAKSAPVTLTLKDVSTPAVLALVCRPLSLTPVRQRGGFLLTTPEAAEAKLITATYDVRGLSSDPEASDLIDAITSTVAPAQWVDVGGPGDIDVTAPGVLTVKQTDDVHLQLETLFATLRGR